MAEARTAEVLAADRHSAEAGPVGTRVDALGELCRSIAQMLGLQEVVLSALYMPPGRPAIALGNGEASTRIAQVSAGHLRTICLDREAGDCALNETGLLQAVQDDVCFCSLALADERGEIVGCLTTARAGAPGEDEASRMAAAGRMALVWLREFCAGLDLEMDFLAVSKRVDRLEWIARTDPLTGLDNSASFEERAREALCDEEPPRALVIFDIDHFKSINDLYGHQFGDSYLHMIADALQEACPDNSIIGRLGGDEFALLLELPRNGQTYLSSVMRRCRASILRHVALLGKPDLGRVSAGAAMFPTHAVDYDKLFDLADSALYASKNSGRGSETVFDAETHRSFNPRELQKKFRHAMATGCIEPHFQPIRDLGTGECVGYELLARWRDPDWGLMKPDAFVQILRDHRYAEDLTNLLVSRGLRALAGCDWQGRRRPGLAINLTTFDLLNPEFVFEFHSLMMDAGGCDWPDIVIEVTEEVMLGPRNGQIFRTLEELRHRGARVALDDFGTGYGGLRHLSGWPVDILKIDRYFVQRLERSQTDFAIVDSIVRLALGSGLKVVAEGIETPEQLKMLTGIGCSLGQGYLFSPAVPVEEIESVSHKLDLDSLMSVR